MLREDGRIFDNDLEILLSHKPHQKVTKLSKRDLIKAKRESEKLHQEIQSKLDDLWGPADEYSECNEDRSSFLQRFYYGWVQGLILLASKEELTFELLPPPTRGTRAHICGRKLSMSLQRSLYQLNSWKNFVSAEVFLKKDPTSRGILHWIGTPQQGKYDSVMAGVEWVRVPNIRAAEHADRLHPSPFFDGIIAGEHLFTPNHEGKSTLEKVSDLVLCEAHADPELQSSILTPKKMSIARSLFSSLPYYFWWQIPFKLSGDICTLTLPLVVKEFVGYLHSPNPSWDYGFLLVFLFFGIQVIQSASLHRFYFTSIKCGLSYRSAVTAVIFEKCFTIAGKSLSLPEMNTGRIINMVSTDVERINDFVQFCMYMWSSPCVALVSIILLYNLLGWCSLMALVTLFATLPINGYVMNKMTNLRKQLVQETDKRVKATNEFLSGIRIAKFMTWEPRFIADIEEKRAAEVYRLKQIQMCRIAFSFISIATPTVMIAGVFIMYHALGNELNPEIVFPTLALLNTIRMPFQMIPYVFTAAAQFFVSATRVTKFLECDNASCATVKDIEELYSEELASGKDLHSTKPAVICEKLEISAFVPIKLPIASKMKNSLIDKFRRRFCCAPFRPRRERFPVEASTAEEDSKKKSSNSKQEERHELSPKTLLQDVTIRIPKGKLTVIFGPTGAGKSALLQAFIGQFEVDSGQIWVTKNIAYVPQQPWIMNATLKENILFFSEDDDAKLKETIRVCQLTSDLTQLASGLQTEIGEKGINLSGGQKARVSLARAVYADRDMYLLDDPLSALDAHVGESILVDCISGKLATKTRVLATHQMRALARADHVIYIEKQTVLFTGDQEAFKASPYYKSVVEDAAHHSVEGADGDGEDTKDNSDAETEKGSIKRQNTENVSENEGKKDDNAVQAGTLMTTEEKAVGSVPFSTYMRYFDYCGGRRIIVIIIFAFTFTEMLAQSGNVWMSLWSSASVSDKGASAQPSFFSNLSDKSFLIIYIIAILFGTIAGPTRYSVAYTALRKGSMNMHKALIRSVSIGTMEFFDTTPLGRILNRFSRDIDVIDNGLQMSTVVLLQCLFSILSSLIISISSQPLMLIALVPCSYFYYRLTVFYNAANREIRRTGSIAKSPMYSLLSEVLSGTGTIQAYGREKVLMKEALKRLDIVYSCSLLENAANRWLGVRIELLSNCVSTSIAFLGVLCMMLKFSVNRGLVSLSLTMAIQTTAQLNWLVRQVAEVEANMNSVERVLHYTNEIPHEELPEISEIADNLEKRGGVSHDSTSTVVIMSNVTPTDTTAVGSRGNLEFKNVQMRYRDGLPLVLKNVSFKIDSKQKVGIVGRTGSGKSTLLLTFMRIVDTCSGEILVDGKAIRSYSLRELRQKFSMIPQDPVLFDGTVRSNVDPFMEASSSEIWDALELVGMKERINNEANGIECRVLEGGSNFSVGQRQLLCMARALLKKGSSFILMDEATANVDPSLDRQLQQTVMTAFADYTVITIAHRLHTVATYDKIIVMENGVVAETGSPRELVSRKNSKFLEMVNALGKAEASAVMNKITKP